MKLHKIAIPCLVRGGYRPHTAPHGGPERPFYFGLLQQARIDQIFPSNVRPTVLSSIPQIQRFVVHVRTGPPRLRIADHSRCARSHEHKPWLASEAHAWASFAMGANCASSATRPNGVISAPTDRKPSWPCFLCFLAFLPTFPLACVAALVKVPLFQQRASTSRCFGHLQ